MAKLGVAAKILEGTVSLGKHDVQGVVMGTSDLRLEGFRQHHFALGDLRQFHELRRALVFAGLLSQTPLTVFLRYGAVGRGIGAPSLSRMRSSLEVPVAHASGPLRPRLLAGRGLLSVGAGPYQLLIVGDPLCRPWADFPQVSVTGVIRGRRERCSAAPTGRHRCQRSYGGLRAGRRRSLSAQCPPRGTFPLDTTTLGDGYHELRVVAIGPPPIESQGRKIVPIRVNNRGRRIAASFWAPGPQPLGRPVTIGVRAPGSIGIVVLQGSRVVAHVAGPRGASTSRLRPWAAGPSNSAFEGLGEAAMQTNVIADPPEFVVQ